MGNIKSIKWKEQSCIYPDLGNCHICTSHYKDSFGRPIIKRNGSNPQIMSRYIYEQNFGKLPENIVVRHKCDTPNCINPVHLEVGTQWDNNHDRAKRERNCKQSGDKNPNAKLTWKLIEFIRSSPTISNKETSKICGVNEVSISNVRNYKTWKEGGENGVLG